MKIAVAALTLLPFCAVAQTEAADPNTPAAKLIAQGIVPPSPILGKPCSHTFWTDTPPSQLRATIVAFNVATDGTVKDVTLQQSSGSDIFDRNLMKCAAGFHYKPATKDGQAVEVPWQLRVD